MNISLLSRMARVSVALSAVLVCFVSCSSLSEDKRLERALDVAGNNRQQLEKVLDHYSNDPDRLEAARWLVMNMPMHYTSTGPEVERYREYFRIASDQSKDIRLLVDSIDSVQGRPDVTKALCVADIATVDSAFLVAHIDKAFEAREKWPWGKNVRWEDFLEFVLPYRVGDEPLSLWREIILEEYEDLIDSVASLKGSEDPLFAADALYVGWIRRKKFKWTSQLPGGPRLGVNITDWKTGACRERADGMTYLLRTAGLPASLHLAPVRGDLNDTHSWGVVYDRNGYPYIPEQHSDSAALFKVPAAKVQCETFSINEGTLRTFTNSPYAPTALRRPFVKDMTMYYLKPEMRSELKIPVQMLAGVTNGDTVYLASASRKLWVPVGFGVVRRDSVDLGYVGAGTVCVVGTLQNGTFRPCGYPFIREGGNGVRFFIPGGMQDVNLYSKCSVQVGDYAQRMKGGVFETADNPSFISPDTIYVINESPKRLFTAVSVSSDVGIPRRFIRYVGAEKTFCNVAEIALYENETDTVPLNGRIIGTPESYDDKHRYTSAWDGDPYTSMDYPKPNGGWTGIDAGRRVQVRKIVYTPRNRDNFIHIGYNYELFYYQKDEGWGSLGTAKASSDMLTMKAPSGALLYLHCLDGGNAERIFEYDSKSDIQLFY